MPTRRPDADATAWRPALAPLLAVLLLIAAPARADEDSFFEKALAGVIVDTPEVWDPVTVFPLVVPEAPDALEVDAAWATPALTIRDRTSRAHEYDLVFGNPTPRPILVLGGTLVTGGKIDRLLPLDLLVPAATQGVEIDALTASAALDMLPAEARAPHQVAGVAAPPYLREHALTVHSHRLVRAFIGHFDAVRTEGEPATLAGVAGAKALAPFCAACRGAVVNFPRLKRPTTVGFILAVGDRIQTVELFATNALLMQAFEPLLAATAFRAASVALRARERGLEPPAVDTQARLAALTTDAKKLLQALRTRTRIQADEVTGDSAGEAVDVWAPGGRGRALGLGGRLVHATVFAHDPFGRALFADPLRYEPEESQDADVPGTAELERRAERGTLTPYERRLLERRRPGGAAGRPRPGVR